MPAIPDISELENAPVDNEQLRRRPIPLDIPTPEGAGRPIVGSTQDLEASVVPSGRMARVIPTTPEIGSTEDLESKASHQIPMHSAPIQTGVASLWAKAHNIHNPILRVLGEIGAGGARALDTIGTIAAPKIAAEIPGSTMNQRATEQRENKQETHDVGIAKTEAETGEAAARGELAHKQAEVAGNPKPEKDKDANQLYADAVSEALDKGIDPAKDPKVQQLADAITSIQKQPATGAEKRDDRAIKIMSKPKAEWNDEEAAYMQGFDQWVNKTKTQPGVTRVEAMGLNREYPVINKQTGELEMRNAQEINSSKGNYAPAGEGAKSMNKTALIEDIRGNVQQVRDSLKSMPEFDTATKAKIAYALHSRDPRGSVNALLTSGAIGSLDPQQQEYLINTALLVENAMAMRSVLGAGQGSEDLRAAITATIPGPTTPTKDYGLKQLDKFEQVLNRLERGIPGMPLKAEQNTGGELKPPKEADPGMKWQHRTVEGKTEWRQVKQ